MWFQNRRTKHKRVQQEGEEPSPSGKKSSGNSGESAMSDDESDIDLEMSDEDDYPMHHNPSATNGMMY